MSGEIVVQERRELAEIVEAPQHPVIAYLARFSSIGGRNGMRSKLQAAVALISGRQTSDITFDELLAYNWHELRRPQVTGLHALLKNSDFKPAYQKGIAAAVRGVMEEAAFADLMPSDDFSKAWHRQKINGSSLPAGRDLSKGEIASIMGICCADDTPAGVRDAALIALGVTTGIRIAEAASMSLEAYDFDSGILTIKGKGNKERIVYAVNGAKNALDDWIDCRGDQPGPMFTPINKAGEVRIASMSRTSLAKMLKRRQSAAGVEDFSWHDLRRTCCGDLLDAGVDLVITQRIMGHASPVTTSRYDRRPETEKRKGLALLHVPYTRRNNGNSGLL